MSHARRLRRPTTPPLAASPLQLLEGESELMPYDGPVASPRRASPRNKGPPGSPRNGAKLATLPEDSEAAPEAAFEACSSVV